MRTLYGITKKLSGDFDRSGEGPIKDKTGAVLTSDKERKARLAEHFHETLNRLPPVELLDFSIYKETEALPIDLEEITLEEINKAIKGMKNHKAAGEDNIAAELVKATSLIVNFIDFQKAAFYSFDCKALWIITEFYGIPIKIIDLIKNLYENSTCTVLVNSERTDPFPVNAGVCQGCILSPILFCIAIDFVIRTTN